MRQCEFSDEQNGGIPVSAFKVFIVVENQTKYFSEKPKCKCTRNR